MLLSSSDGSDCWNVSNRLESLSRRFVSPGRPFLNLSTIQLLLPCLAMPIVAKWIIPVIFSLQKLMREVVPLSRNISKRAREGDRWWMRDGTCLKCLCLSWFFPKTHSSTMFTCTHCLLIPLCFPMVRHGEKGGRYTSTSKLPLKKPHVVSLSTRCILLQIHGPEAS